MKSKPLYSLILFPLCALLLSGSCFAADAAAGDGFGAVSLLPVIITVALAFITREVVFSLLAGLFFGYMTLCGSGGAGIFAGLCDAFTKMCGGILQTLSDEFHAAIIISCLSIGGMVELINSSGGFAALAGALTKNISSPQRAALTAQLMGMCLFFDDYANSLITGPVMRGITDRQGVSREKLAYIVDSTAAPVAGIAIISSWIAAELSAIEEGFSLAGVSQSAYSSFIAGIPYCFYNFAAVTMVLSTSLLEREYGPMLKSERRARAGEPLRRGSAAAPDESSMGGALKQGSIFSALLPVLTLIIYAFVGFYSSGMKNAAAAGLVPQDAGFSLAQLSLAFGNADTVTVLMQASILSSLIALCCGLFGRRQGLSSGFAAWLRGMSGISSTAVILILAWSLSSVIGELGAAYYLVDLVSLHLPYQLLPMLIFICCCLISFGTGSFGCMMIVMPIAIPIACAAAGGETLVFACIAAVLSGSIFGDHCSPVTDTTILSSLGAGCDNLDHVKTQLPYALTAAGIVSLFGYLPAGFGINAYICVFLCAAAGFLAVRLLGKRI